MSLLINLEWSFINDDGDCYWRKCFPLITRWFRTLLSLTSILLKVKKRKKHKYAVKYAEMTRSKPFVGWFPWKEQQKLSKFGLRLTLSKQCLMSGGVILIIIIYLSLPFSLVMQVPQKSHTSPLSDDNTLRRCHVPPQKGMWNKIHLISVDFDAIVDTSWERRMTLLFSSTDISPSIFFCSADPPGGRERDERD